MTASERWRPFGDVLVPTDRELVTAARDVRRGLAAVGPEQVRTEGDFGRVSLPYEDCDALRDLLVAVNARVLVEIGLAYSSSALPIGEPYCRDLA